MSAFYFVAVAVTVNPVLADASTVAVYFHDPLALSNTAAPLSSAACVLFTMGAANPGWTDREEADVAVTA